MADFDEYYEADDISSEVSNRLAEEYIDMIFESRRGKKIAQKHQKLDLDDINANLNILKSQIDQVGPTGYGRVFPCIRVGNISIPINIDQYVNDVNKMDSIVSGRRGLFDRFPINLFRMFDYAASEKNDDLGLISHDSLRKIMIETLSYFIKIRYSSFFNEQIVQRIKRSFIDTPPSVSNKGIENKYLTISLSTINHGLQIQASPAYFISWSYFGNPTSPISGYLKPGRYIFGGQGLGLPTFTVDKTFVDVPPNFNVNLNAL
jgi:hypothetical protein